MLLAAPGLTEQEAKEGFVSLFDGKTLDQWRGDVENYTAKEGLLVCEKKGRRLFAKKEYGDFIFRFEFKLPPGGNNGICVRGMEIQILDDTAPRHKDLQPYQYHGSIYGRVPAKRGHQKPVGQWNSEEIRVRGKHVTVTLNGVVIVDSDTDHPALARPKGHLGFKGHGTRVEFRNLRIKEL